MDLLIAAGVISPPGRPKPGKPELIVQIHQPADLVAIAVEDDPEPVAELPAAVTDQLPDDEPSS